MIFTVEKELVTTFSCPMRDLSLRQVYSFLQSKMAHLAMNGSCFRDMDSSVCSCYLYLAAIL